MSGMRGKRSPPSRSQTKRRVEEAKRRSLLVGLLTFALLAVILGLIAWQFIFSLPPQRPPVGAGSLAPDFTLPIVGPEGLKADKISLSSLKGRAVFLEFMVSWCEYCKRMAPVIESLYRAYSNRGIFFLSVAGTWRGASAETTAQFIREFKTSWPHVLDADNSVFERYAVTGTPTYFIIAPDGRIAFRFVGAQSYEALAEAIEKVLPRPTPV